MSSFVWDTVAVSNRGSAFDPCENPCRVLGEPRFGADVPTNREFNRLKASMAWAQGDQALQDGAFERS
jgi:hypothetical protein